jgi:uncharacterized protein
MANIVNIGYNQKIVDIINECGADILGSPEFEREKDFIQHGVTSTYAHSLSVTYISVWLALKSRHKVDMKSIVRGALLHDYFLYDWHEKRKGHNVHGYTHARVALMNARKDFEINKKEAEIIYCHMFPLNISRVPLSREARIVCIADKLCAGGETLSLLNTHPEFVNI